ncbi:MAG: alpha/beta fold hydrolase [Pseudomonadales bacterium]
MPRVYSVDFADAAHLPNMEHPQRFNASVERFLATL